MKIPKTSNPIQMKETVEKEQKSKHLDGKVDLTTDSECSVSCCDGNSYIRENEKQNSSNESAAEEINVEPITEDSRVY